MVKPLRSDNPNPPSVQFKDFGVLNDGSQSKGAFTTSIVTNIVAALLVIVIGSAVKNTIAAPKPKEVTFAEIPKEPPPPPPPPPKIIPPPPPKIEPPKIEPPKIKLPEKLPEIKPVEVKMPPQPVHLAPAPPKLINPPPAPVKVNLAPAKAASVANNDPHPTAIKLGTPDNPIKAMTGPAVAKVNLGNAGAPGMPPGNTGNGPHATKPDMGSGSRYGTNLAGNTNSAGKPVDGVKLGCVGCTGPKTSTNYNNAPVQPTLQVQRPAEQQSKPTVQAIAKGNPPKLLSRPQPVYTDEAKALHLEGSVVVSIRVTANGSVQVIGVTRGLGHGLDQQALRVAQGMRFQPATDGSGNPKDWEGPVTVTFQLAG